MGTRVCDHHGNRYIADGTTGLMIARRLLVVILTFFPAGAIARSWFLNGMGSDGIYHIWEFGDDGLVSGLAPALSPPSGVLHLAWPSAIAPDSRTRRLYASAYTTGWFQVRLWTSTNGGAWIPQGIAFQSDASEPGGIGPAQVVYEPGAAAPYMIYYLDRASNQIKLATSVDGMTFARQGTVITPLTARGGVRVVDQLRLPAREW